MQAPAHRLGLAPRFLLPLVELSALDRLPALAREHGDEGSVLLAQPPRVLEADGEQAERARAADERHQPERFEPMANARVIRIAGGELLRRVEPERVALANGLHGGQLLADLHGPVGLEQLLEVARAGHQLELLAVVGQQLDGGRVCTERCGALVDDDPRRVDGRDGLRERRRDPVQRAQPFGGLLRPLPRRALVVVDARVRECQRSPVRKLVGELELLFVEAAL